VHLTVDVEKKRAATWKAVSLEVVGDRSKLRSLSHQRAVLEALSRRRDATEHLAGHRLDELQFVLAL
jgi:hypothetical protein